MDNAIDSPPYADNTLNINQIEMEAKMTFPAYTISAAAFWGQILLTLFMITGLVSIPFALFTSWRDRPIPMGEN